MRPIKIGLALLALLLLLSVNTGFSQSSEQRFVGTYTMSRVNFDSPEVLTLVLKNNNIATLTTGFPRDKGLKPMVETGTWRLDGDGPLIELNRNGNMKEDVKVKFEAKGDTLVAIEFDKLVFGANGLQFKRQK
jgi:hypothetical protein